MSVASAIWRKLAGLLLRAEGWKQIGRQTAAALRCLPFPRHVAWMLRDGYLLQVARRRLLNRKSWDPLHFMSNSGYLARGWPLRKRFEAALYHYEQDSTLYDDAYLQRVEGGTGLLLWASGSDGHAFDLRLVAPADSRCEGDLCVQMRVDDVCVACMAFAWIDSAAFGDAQGHSMFVTRNQTLRVPELETFRASFRQNSPTYFCLAAVCAIAQVDGMRHIYGIRHDRQLSYRPEYEQGFRNSYTDFWTRFGGQPSNDYALQVNLPLKLTSLQDLKPSHRSRAERRRAQWAEVATQTHSVIGAHRRRSSPTAESTQVGRPTSLFGFLTYWITSGLECVHLPLTLV
jgi:uncharacterized protein VirK/YbjX